MAKVYVSIGSNIDRERHIVASLDALAKNFSGLEVSSVYESEAVGFSGDHFFNLVAGFDTAMSVGELSACLREIEHDNGRNRGQERFSARTLDIDILMYDQCADTVDGITLPRAEILENAFVLLPLAEIAPTGVHPVRQQTFSVLWQAYSRQQKLWAVDFFWRGQQISQRQATA
ncbi:MAG TPA: 2-amino-4-hydroxy-6-hydroxymethyldihydropteridine diphosphokinase [Pseudomonadales bacterium]|nr:2-amino-4-hydroxy-6-hydroxymethyldihydropteridine diphosphokinase [Pseudomonadales bacterium]